MYLFLAVEISFLRPIFKKVSKNLDPPPGRCPEPTGGPDPQTPSRIQCPYVIKWQPTIELVSPTIKNITKIPVLIFYYQLYYYLYMYFCIKNLINTNCVSIDHPFLQNKKDSQAVISNI